MPVRMTTSQKISLVNTANISLILLTLSRSNGDQLLQFSWYFTLIELSTIGSSTSIDCSNLEAWWTLSRVCRHPRDLWLCGLSHERSMARLRGNYSQQACAKELLGIIRNRVAVTLTTADRLSPSRKACFRVPFERGSKFASREEMITEIGRQFRRPGRVATASVGGVWWVCLVIRVNISLT